MEYIYLYSFYVRACVLLDELFDCVMITQPVSVLVDGAYLFGSETQWLRHFGDHDGILK